jgi:hypothetical protein
MSDDELQRAVGRIEGKLDEVLGLTKRVQSLEQWRAYLTGAWVVVSLFLANLWLK